jgi:NAD(P)-dependent dehydrogenase (short-subunit alcohol dehydrogenase family)
MTQPALLIVGGTHGIGKEIARHYAKQGWSVVLTGRDGSTAKAVAPAASLWTSPSQSWWRER